MSDKLDAELSEDSFEEMVVQAKRLANLFQEALHSESQALATMAACVLIHELDPNGTELPEFAKTLLRGREWIDVA